MGWNTPMQRNVARPMRMPIQFIMDDGAARQNLKLSDFT